MSCRGIHGSSCILRDMVLRVIQSREVAKCGPRRRHPNAVLRLQAVLAVDAQIRMSSLFAIAVLLVHAFTFPFSFSSFRATFSATRRLNLRVPPGGAFSDLDT